MKSWKTTVVGTLGAGVLTAQTIIQTGTLDTRTIIIASFLGMLGFLAKDKNVTGTGKR